MSVPAFLIFMRGMERRKGAYERSGLVGRKSSDEVEKVMRREWELGNGKEEERLTIKCASRYGRQPACLV